MSNLQPADQPAPEAADSTVTIDTVRTVIFPKLTLTYGSLRMDTMYDGLDQEFVAQDWAVELQGVPLAGVHWALRHLPATDFPPNVQQFRRSCAERPNLAKRAEQPQLGMKGGSIVPDFAREVSRRIREGEGPEEPQKIRAARSFLGRYDRPGAVLCQVQREWLPHMRHIVARYDEQQKELSALAEKKAEAQAKVDAHQQQEVAHGTPEHS